MFRSYDHRQAALPDKYTHSTGRTPQFVIIYPANIQNIFPDKHDISNKMP
jgi:hypothetical protein